MAENPKSMIVAVGALREDAVEEFFELVARLIARQHIQETGAFNGHSDSDGASLAKADTSD